MAVSNPAFRTCDPVSWQRRGGIPYSEEAYSFYVMTVYAHIFGEAPVKLWGLSSRERYRRVLAPVGVTAIVDDLSSLSPDDSVLIVRGDYLLDGRILQGLVKSLHIMIEASAGPSRAVIAAHVPATWQRRRGQFYPWKGVRHSRHPSASKNSKTNWPRLMRGCVNRNHPLQNRSGPTRNECWRSACSPVPIRGSLIWSRNGCGLLLPDGPCICA